MSKKKKKSKSFGHQVLEKFIEIILIIISVYIALGVENWSEHRKDHERLLNYYSSFVNEISEDIKSLKTEQADAKKHIKNANTAIQLSSSKNGSDSIKKLFFTMFKFSDFASSKMLSYKSMVVSGDLKLINNLKLRQELIELEMSYGAVKIQEDLLIDFLTKNMTEFISSKFDLLTFNPTDKYYYRQKEFRNLIIRFSGYNAARLSQYERALISARKCLKLVQQELNQNQS